MSVASRLGVAAAVALVGALAWMNWRLVDTPVDISPIAPPAARLDGRQSGTEFAADASSRRQLPALRDTVERVLFSPTRRPPVAAAEQPPADRPARAETTSTANLRLVGVMRSGGDAWRALIRAEDGAEWHGVGARVAGWRLAEIEPERVVLEERGRRLELSLHPTR